jgi:hypothetical protein
VSFNEGKNTQTDSATGIVLNVVHKVSVVGVGNRSVKRIALRNGLDHFHQNARPKPNPRALPINTDHHSKAARMALSSGHATPAKTSLLTRDQPLISSAPDSSNPHPNRTLAQVSSELVSTTFRAPLRNGMQSQPDLFLDARGFTDTLAPMFGETQKPILSRPRSLQ